MNFTVYFTGSLQIEADSIEQAWEKWHKFVDKYTFDFDDIDIYKDKDD